ncbi:MAG TPA: carboxypeptidase regulatory-like domain-containing protein, partial [Acidiferrobacterales bacterium]
RFALADVDPGQYTLRYQLAGFNGATQAAAVQAGQVVDLGTIRLTALPDVGVITGIVVDAASGQPLAGVRIDVGGATTASATTDALGSYRIVSPPGAVTVAASAAGYDSVTGAGTVVAGGTLSFSPALNLSGTTPSDPAVTLIGEVVDADSGAPLAGAQVSIQGSASATADGAGRFLIEQLTAGTLDITVSFSGYQAVAYTAIAPEGATVDLGAVRLTRLATPTTTTVIGRILDAASGAPVAGASVSTQGASVVSAADGSYRIEGIATTQFTLSASAVGYLTNSGPVSLAAHGTASVDIQLQRAASTDFDITGVTTDSPSYAALVQAEIKAGLRNTASQPRTVRLYVKIVDAAGGIVDEYPAVAIPLGGDPAAALLTVDANGERDGFVTWNTGRHAPGGYQVVVQAYDASSGQLLAERGANVQVEPTTRLGGGAEFDPPIAQLAANRPVAIRAALSNQGNQPIGPATVTARVSLKNAGYHPRRDLVSVETLVSGQGLASPQAMDVDAGGNLYVADSSARSVFKITPAGDTSVFADGLNGPLDVDLDDLGNVYVLESTRTIVRVAPGGIRTNVATAPTGTRAISVAADGRIYCGSGNTLYVIDPSGDISTVVGAGLSTPMGIVVNSRGEVLIADRGANAIARYTPGAGLSSWVTGIAQPYGLAIDTADNVYVTSFSGNSLLRVAPDGTVTTIATGLAGPYDVKLAPNGSFIVSNSNSSEIVSITPGGDVTPVVGRTVHQPSAVTADAAGNVYVANTGARNIVQYGPDGIVREVAAGTNPASAITVEADGGFVTLESTSVVRTAPGGARTVLATGLSTPYSLIAAPDGDGHVVSEPNAHRLRRVGASGQLSVYNDANFIAPRHIRRDAAGNLYLVSTQGHITRVAPDERVSRLGSGLSNPQAVAVAANGDLLVAEYGRSQVVRVSPSGDLSVVATLSFRPAALAIAPSGDILVSALGGTVIHAIDAGGALREYATVSRAIRYGMLFTPSGDLWVAHTNNASVTRIAVDGSQTLIATASSPQSLADDGQGGVYVGIAGGVQRIDAAGVVTRPVPAGVVSIQGQVGVEYDSAGRLWVLDAAGVLVRFNPDLSVDRRFSTLQTPRGLTVDAGGAVLVANRGNNTLVRIPGPDRLPEMLASLAFDRIAFESGSTILVASTAAVQRLDLATGTLTSIVAGYSNIAGIARRADGGIAVIDRTRNEFGLYAATGGPLDRFVGVVNPRGILFDAGGNLLIANSYPNGILRINAAGRTELFATVANVSYLHREGDGRFMVTRGTQVSSISTTGVVLASYPSLNATGIVRDAAGTLYVSADTTGALLRFDADGNYQKVASGLASLYDIGLAADGRPYVGDNSRGVVNAVNPDGTLSLVAPDLPTLSRFFIDTQDQLFVAYATNKIAQFDPSGARTELPTQDVVQGQINGIAGHDGAVYAVGAARIVYKLIAQSTAPDVVPGDVVLVRSAALPGLGLDGQAVAVDFGAWTPTVSGDFEVEVSVAGVDGIARNSLHVGPNAEATLTLAHTETFPGDQAVTGYLRIEGADSTSITRIDPAGTHLAAASGAQGRAIGADSQGNIYAADTNRIVRITPAGVVSNFVIGVSVGNGLAVDSRDNIYAVSARNVLKFTVDGSMTTLATLPSTARAVAVDYADVVYAVEQSNRLSRIRSDGTVELVTTQGLNGPLGLTIDAYGTFYVLNSNNNIVRISADAGAAALYFNQARFEFEGVNVTADCSNNLLFAPIQLPPFKASGEEDIIVQLVGDTGEVRQVLYGPSIDPDMADMDVLFYDRLGKRLLIWTDRGNGKIFSFPVICGGIDADVHIVTSTTVDLSSTDPAPTSVTDRGDGTREYVWVLSDVDNRGRQVQLNLLFRNLVEGESRPMAHEAYVEFKNSFAPGENVRVPIAIPKLTARSAVSIVPVLDALEYPADATAGISVTVRNESTQSFDGTLELAIVDGGGAMVADLPAIPVSGVPGLSEQPYTSSWDVGRTLAGNYKLVATLKNALGQPAASGEVAFRIIGGDAAQAVVRLRTTTDRPVYHTTDTVNIENLVANVTANAIVDDAVLRVTVLDAAGQPVFSLDGPLGQLPPGSLRDMMLPYLLNAAPVAHYRVVGQVLDGATQAELARAEAGFDVEFNLERALTGKVVAQLPVVEPGATQVCTATLTNRGNLPVTGLEVHHVLVNIDTGQTDNELLQTVDLDAGASIDYAYQFSSQGLAAGNYACVLQVRFGDALQTLGYAPFVVRPPAVDVDLTLRAAGTGRLLVLLDNGRHGNDDDDDKSCRGVTRLELGSLLATPLSPAAVVEARVFDRHGVLVDRESTTLAAFVAPVNANAVADGADLAIVDLTAQRLTVSLTAAPAGAKLGTEYSVEAVIMDGSTVKLSSGPIHTSCSQPIAVGDVHGLFGITGLDLLPAANDAKYDDRDPHGPKDAPGLAAQRAVLEQLLAAAGWSYTITDTAEDFTREFHTGGYSAYALLAEHEKLSETVQKELREAVFRGEGLVVAGAHDSRNLHHERLRDALGIKPIGHVSHATGVELVTSPLDLTGHLALIPGDKAQRIERLTATSAGVYLTDGTPGKSDDDDCRDPNLLSQDDHGKDDNGARDDDECHGHPERYLDAVTLNAYGQGRAAFAGFDLLAAAARDGQTGLAARLLTKLIAHVQPATLAPAAGGVVPIELVVANRGVATGVTVTVTLPAGVTPVDAGSAAVQSNTLRWTLNLAADAEQLLRFWIKLPAAPGTVTLTAAAEANGQPLPDAATRL